MFLRAIGFTLLLGLFAIPVKAESFRIASSKCKVYKKVGKNKWKRLRKSPFKKGIKISGKRTRKGIFFKYYGKIHRVSKKCVKSKRVAKKKKRKRIKKISPPVVASNQSQERVSRKELLEINRAWEFYFGIFSIQEPLTLTASSETYELLSTHTGVCPGLSYSKRLGKYFAWGGFGCAMLALSEAAESTGSATAPILYRVKGATMYGVQLGPQIFWRAPSGSALVGLSAPVFFRLGSWPNPNDGSTQYTVSPQPAIAPSLFLDSRFGFGKFSLSFRFGFFRTFSSISWMLGGYYDF